MIPKYSNPSTLLSSTAIVSRAALRDDSDDEAEPAQTNPEHAQLVARLENILKRSIDETLLQKDGAGDGELPRKKKRRKVDKGGQEDDPVQDAAVQEEVAVPFRLLSGSSQPKPIVLAPKAPPKIISQGPAAEDTEAEAERRAARAREVAVDFAWVSAQASKNPPIPSRKVVQLVAHVPDADPPLILLERQIPPPKAPRVAQLNPEVEIEPSPHEPEVACCPVIAARDPHIETAKRKRRRGKVREKQIIQAAFWSPPPGVGGKALGYAWGYASSRPQLTHDAPRGYE